ncbi:hypothetical protein ACIQ7N_03095 [Lysinibacillus sp. NPDC095746]|uniref:hypothetical protein n=1 Tax=Lysinibacillus sp. NPDC095746 TaxID=3364134 RepID=UPI003814E8DC
MIKYISWKATKGHKNDFISEYKLMKKHGYYTNASKNIKNQQAKMYNKISSPGRKYHFQRYGKY